jgi:hypothetical protein
MAFEPPILALNCNVRHWTGQPSARRTLYAYLRLFAFGEDGTYGVIERAWQSLYSQTRG